MNNYQKRKLPLWWIVILAPFGTVMTAFFFIAAGSHVNQIQQSLGIHQTKIMGLLIYTFFTGISAGIYCLLLKGKSLNFNRAGLKNEFPKAGILATLIAFVVITLILYPLMASLLKELNIPMLLNGNGQISFYQLPLPKAMIVILSACILGPLFEEIVFRGYVFQMLYERTGKWPAIILSALVFAAIHIYSYGPGFVIWVFFFAMAAAYLYEKYDSIYPGLLFHIVNNLWAFLLIPILFKS